MAKLTRLSLIAPIIIKSVVGDPGQVGRQGEPGERGPQGKSVVGDPGQVGRQGEPGVQGPVPEHQVRNGEIRFKNPDGSWGLWVRLGPAAGGGPDSLNTYTLIETATFKILRRSLLIGTNIFGVNFDGDVTITLPDGIDKRIIIVVNDESNNAGANNITITTDT